MNTDIVIILKKVQNFECRCIQQHGEMELTITLNREAWEDLVEKEARDPIQNSYNIGFEDGRSSQ